MRLVLWMLQLRAAQSGCDGLNTKSTLQVRLSARDNQIIYTVSSFFRGSSLAQDQANKPSKTSPPPTDAPSSKDLLKRL